MSIPAAAGLMGDNRLRGRVALFSCPLNILASRLLMSAKRDGTDLITFLNGIAHGVANLKCATVPGPCFPSGSRAPKRPTAALRSQRTLRRSKFLVKQVTLT